MAAHCSAYIIQKCEYFMTTSGFGCERACINEQGLAHLALKRQSGGSSARGPAVETPRTFGWIAGTETCKHCAPEGRPRARRFTLLRPR